MSNDSHMNYATISLGFEAHLHDICLYRLPSFLPVFCTVNGTQSFLNKQHNMAVFVLISDVYDSDMSVNKLIGL